MIRIIINGDDFGISREVNKAISECFEERILTSTTLMVNMPYADEAVELAKEQGFYESVGLHFNLTGGTPLTDSIKAMKRFCRKNGTFNAYFQKHTASRLRLTKEELACVAEEAEAQIRKYISYGLPARHLDSHHHVHTNLPVWRVLVPLLHKYDFRSVRLSRNLFKRTAPLNAVYKKFFNSGLKKSRFITTDYFGSFKDLQKCRRMLKDNTLLELMLHPMYSEDGELCDTRNPMSDVLGLLESIDAQRVGYSVL
ncbi:MAG: ChbG/HpnK family deacetylase [Lachnospiraceae bacterium]|nr:ChbG/HpnK family deacetylase [Lachnospiraceae bacterium]